MKRIGEHYTDLQRVTLRNGFNYIRKGTTLMTVEPAFCEAALHYNRKQPPIPKGTRVVVEYTFMNFYGTYCRVYFKGRRYDLKCSELVMAK